MNEGIIYKFLKFWVGPNLPDVHIFKSDVSIKSPLVFFRHWIIHPIKRRIAKYYLIILRRITKIEVIGITGSAGKTTTKEMIASILKSDGEVVSSFKNIDPVYNIPTAILNCGIKTKYLVLEMGVEYPKEMDFYLWLSKPDISLITNVYPTHTEFLKDIDGVFNEKIKIATKNSRNHLLIYNKDCLFLDRKLRTLTLNKLAFGKGTKVHASNIRKLGMSSLYTLNIGKSKIDIHLPLYGQQFIEDSIAAASVSKELGMNLKTIKKGLENYNIPEHRMNIFKEKGGSIIIDDTYNNNPHAAEEAIISFNELSNGMTKGMVFGDMLELGEGSEEYHRRIGKIIGKSNLDFLICVGRFSEYVFQEALKGKNNLKVHEARSLDEAYKILKGYLGKRKIILLKGSRSIGLDRIVDRLSI